MPAIAVVISTYNNPAFLRLVLEGYRRQSDRNFAVYIADDGSGEETRQLIRQFQSSFPVPIHHLWQEDQGFRKARIHNLALQAIREPYVLLTDGDCVPVQQLVATHRRLARPGTLISGSRILVSRRWTEQLIGQTALDTAIPLPGWLLHRCRGDINRLLPLLLSTRLSSPHQRLEGIRGCHLSCHLEDLHRINGFDESYEGWGREDSDLVARLFNAGLQRCDLKGAPVFHLWHAENTRHRLDANDGLLAACIREKRIRAQRGLAQLGETA